MRKPKVYLINNKDFNVSSAEVYGDLEMLYEGMPKNVFSTSQHAFGIKIKLKDMQASDYLIIAGNMILVLIAFGIIYEKFGFVNVLLYDSKSCLYTARVIPKHQLSSEKGE